MDANEQGKGATLDELVQPGLKRVFLCYCPQDLRAAERLQVHLAGCQHVHRLIVWDHARLPAGASWQAELAAALASAQVAVVLVSADFLATPLITTYQLPSLLEAAQTRGTRILSVILSPCLFEESPLATFQPINPTRPLSLLSPSQRDAVWVSLVRVIVAGLTLSSSQQKRLRESG